VRGTKRSLLVVLLSGITWVSAAAQCPQRPAAGAVVKNPYTVTSVNGVLSAELTMKHSVDDFGYNHYCYKYETGKNVVEAPTLRLNQGDELELEVKDHIQDNEEEPMGLMDQMEISDLKPCGDTGTPTVSSTNVHYHGLNVPPKCHGDEVVRTLIQPGSPGFHYKIQIPTDEPPGLYRYHPHIHGFTEFQVNGGAAGALIVEGMDKVRPEVAGLRERVFLVRQQFLVPWIPGPYELSLNYVTADYPQFASPIIQMKPGEKQFWRVVNATNQDFLPLQVQFNSTPQKLQLIALDGYPLAKPRYETTILVPPAGRAEFIVEAPPQGVTATFQTLTYSTGPTGNPDIPEPLGDIELSNDDDNTPGTDTAEVESVKSAKPAVPVSLESIKFAGLAKQKPTTQRKLYFSEEFGGVNGPIQFYITVDGQKQKVFEPNEKPAIVTHVGAVEDWTIENRALETHAFHIHQIHFMMLEVDGKPVKDQDLRDTIEIPFWEGPGHPYHSVKVRMDFRDPTIAGTFVYHCHILLHEDLGMMHKILVLPK